MVHATGIAMLSMAINIANQTGTRVRTRVLRGNSRQAGLSALGALARENRELPHHTRPNYIYKELLNENISR